MNPQEIAIRMVVQKLENRLNLTDIQRDFLETWHTLYKDSFDTGEAILRIGNNVRKYSYYIPAIGNVFGLSLGFACCKVPFLPGLKNILFFQLTLLLQTGGI